MNYHGCLPILVVVKTLPLEVGIVVFLSISGSLTPPNVSIPSVRGVTSSKTMI